MRMRLSCFSAVPCEPVAERGVRQQGCWNGERSRSVRLETFATLHLRRLPCSGAACVVGPGQPRRGLLVLLALGRWARGDHSPIPFADIEKPLTTLLQTYGPRGAGNPQEPFWRLRRDGVGELGGTERLAARQGAARHLGGHT
jgi:hypothetical protein